MHGHRSCRCYAHYDERCFLPILSMTRHRPLRHDYLATGGHDGRFAPICVGWWAYDCTGRTHASPSVAMALWPTAMDWWTIASTISLVCPHAVWRWSSRRSRVRGAPRYLDLVRGYTGPPMAPSWSYPRRVVAGGTGASMSLCRYTLHAVPADGSTIVFTAQGGGTVSGEPPLWLLRFAACWLSCTPPPLAVLRCAMPPRLTVGWRFSTRRLRLLDWWVARPLVWHSPPAPRAACLWLVSRCLRRVLVDRYPVATSVLAPLWACGSGPRRALSLVAFVAAGWCVGSLGRVALCLPGGGAGLGWPLWLLVAACRCPAPLAVLGGCGAVGVVLRLPVVGSWGGLAGSSAPLLFVVVGAPCLRRVWGFCAVRVVGFGGVWWLGGVSQDGRGK